MSLRLATGILSEDEALTVSVRYARQQGAPVALMAASFTPAPSGTRDLPLRVDISACLADAGRAATPVADECPLLVVVTLTDIAGGRDSVTLGPVAVAAGGPPVSMTAVVPRPVASVAVLPAPTTVVVGSTMQLVATSMDARGTPLSGRTTTWSSSNAGIASVSATGLVTGVSAGGPVTVTATSEGRTGIALVTVVPPPTILGIQREAHGVELVDSLPETAFPRGGSYTAVIWGLSLAGVTAFATGNPAVTGTVLTASSTMVRVSLTSTQVAEGAMSQAPIPDVGFSLSGPGGVVSSGSVRFNIVTGPRPVVRSFRVTNGVTEVPRGGSVVIEFEAEFDLPGNPRHIFVGASDAVITWGSSSGDAYRTTFRFALTTSVPANSPRSTFEVRSGVVVGSGELGDANLELPVR